MIIKGIRSILFIFAMIQFFTNSHLLKAQDDDYSVKYRRYGFALGYSPLYIFQNFNQTNIQLQKAKMGEITPNSIFNHAFQVYFYSGFLPNFRLGAIFSSGFRSIKADFLDLKKEYEYDLSFWALSFDYALPVGKRKTLALGLLLGQGKQQHLFSQNNSTPMSWDDFWSDYSVGKPNLSFMNELSASFLLYSPYLSFEYGISDFIALKFTGGYLGSVKSALEFENFFEVTNTPAEINLNNFYVQFGLLFGIIME